LRPKIHRHNTIDRRLLYKYYCRQTKYVEIWILLYRYMITVKTKDENQSKDGYYIQKDAVDR
jgi:hypothetical protein